VILHNYTRLLTQRLTTMVAKLPADGSARWHDASHHEPRARRARRWGEGVLRRRPAPRFGARRTVDPPTSSARGLRLRDRILSSGAPLLRTGECAPSTRSGSDDALQLDDLLARPRLLLFVFGRPPSPVAALLASMLVHLLAYSSAYVAKQRRPVDPAPRSSAACGRPGARASARRTAEHLRVRAHRLRRRRLHDLRS